jgi:DNA-binding NtrC family response regulator
MREFLTPVADGHAHIRSNAYHAVLHQLERFARDETALILLQGESGTGKTTLARRIHALSPRSAGPFQTVTLSALNDGVSNSELFGHVHGAFTDARHTRPGHFVSSTRGTLFLDEIGKASPNVQRLLLHAIEYREITPVGADRPVRVDTRIVAATNVDLAGLVAEDRFLPDLYSRIQYFRITVPPLRERRADIPGLITEAVRRHAPAAGYAQLPTLDEALMEALGAAPWPGNLRELDGVIHRILVDAMGASPITLGHCSADLDFLGRARRSRRKVTDAEVAEVLKRTNNDLSAAARIIGKDRKILRLARQRLEAGTSQPQINDSPGTSQAN